LIPIFKIHIQALKRNREEEGVLTLQKVAKLELPDQAHAFVDSLDELLRNFARKTDNGKRSYRDCEWINQRERALSSL
jgi:hypothetical protein